ncbi:MAG: VWA domain-containing protein, partial [Candidatus Bathyarchaeia archaeon]
MQRKRLVFPFSAIVGLDKLKLAVLINAINPKIGGVLIRGPKGSGKSTIVRSLTDILPKITVVKGCPFNCNPQDVSNMCPIHAEEYKEKGELPTEEREMVVVDLPLGATEDRVIGSLDVEKAIKQGIQALEPGILAEANQNILYVDEINLLPDHIADDLLDAVATGWNIVEREGISVSHPSRFIFIGTMNPEEGELRPQLLDRFPLSVNVGNILNAKDRVEIVKRNMEFEADPEKFYQKYRTVQEEIRSRIAKAREILNSVRVPDELLESISNSCLELKVDGLRPDIVIAKAAATLAAFENRTEVTLNDVLVAAELALSHRTREGGFLEPASPQEIAEVFAAKAKKLRQVEETGEASKEKAGKKPTKGRAIFWVKRDATEQEEEKLHKKQSLWDKIQEKRKQFEFHFSRLLGGLTFAIAKRLKKGREDADQLKDGYQIGQDKIRGETLKEKVEDKKKEEKRAIPTVSKVAGETRLSEGVPLLTSFKLKFTSPSTYFLKMKKARAKGISAYAGRHAHAVTELHKGRPYRWRFPHGKPADIHLPATLRQAARMQKTRKKPPNLSLCISVDDVREKLRLYKAPLTMVFVMDLSGSMLLRLGAVKEALLKLHSEAYRFRDRVGIVALKDLGAVVLQHPVTNLRVVSNKLVNMRVSGYTPLATGMMKAWELLREAKRRDPSTVPVMVIVTDGSANVPLQKDPLTGKNREILEFKVIVREYEDMAVQDVMTVAKMIKREGVHTIVVNTNPNMYGRETYGFAVTKSIASVTGGAHHIVG